MSYIDFKEGVALEAEYLNKASDYIRDSIKNQYTDTHTFGVINDKSPKNIIYTDGSSIGLYGLIAYDCYGNRIEVPTIPDDSSGVSMPSVFGLLPDENNMLVQGGTALLPQTSYTLVIRHTETDNEPIAHHVVTGEPKMLGKISGYELYLRDLGVTYEGDIALGSISVDVNGVLYADESTRVSSIVLESSITASIDSATSDYGSNITFSSHINSVGHGTVSQVNPHGLSAEDLGIDTSATANHQKLLHVDGIRSNDITSTTSAMCPSYIRETASDYESITIQPLNDGLEELAIINGISVFPSDFSAGYTFNFGTRATQEDLGYYLFSFDVTKVNTNETKIVISGPFSSEEDDGFVTALNTPTLFPICSLKWDYVEYDLTADSSAVAYSYDIIPSTFKDRRVFNNTSLKNFRPDDAFALTQFAPVANDRAMIHCAQIVSNKRQTKFANLAGKTLKIIADGTPVTLIFTGNADASAPIPAKEVVEQIKIALTTVDATNSNMTYLRAFPRIISYSSGSSDYGKIAISAPYSIQIEESQAADILGFSTAYANLSNISTGLIKEMVYYGERTGYIEFVYDYSEKITQINYYLGGGKVRRNIFHYNGDFIIRVDEIIDTTDTDLEESGA